MEGTIGTARTGLARDAIPESVPSSPPSGQMPALNLAPLGGPTLPTGQANVETASTTERTPHLSQTNLHREILPAHQLVYLAITAGPKRNIPRPPSPLQRHKSLSSSKRIGSSRSPDLASPKNQSWKRCPLGQALCLWKACHHGPARCRFPSRCPAIQPRRFRYFAPLRRQVWLRNLRRRYSRLFLILKRIHSTSTLLQCLVR